MKRLRAVILLLIVCAIAPALADSIQLKDGRLDAGPVTVLTMSDAQLLTARTKRVVVLTDEQRSLLSTDAKVSPTVLSVYTLKGASAGIHPCFEYNFSLWFTDRKLEVPHRYLVSDDDAAKRAEELDEL